MNLWNQNVINWTRNFSGAEGYNIFEFYDKENQVLGFQVLNCPANIAPTPCAWVECWNLLTETSLTTVNGDSFVFLNLPCASFSVNSLVESPTSWSVFYTSPASGTLMIADDTHTAFIENKMDLGDIFTIGFLTIFLSLVIFKFIWDFIHPKIVKIKTINDL